MTPERWKQIEQLYHSILKSEPSQRAAFLEDACAGDEELRREVESLLAFEQRAESFIEAPPVEALEDAARWMAADPTKPSLTGEIGHYQILSRLGEGGMGVVYKARDKNLGRSVALKVLSAGLVANPEHRRRLVLEARMASALNHPNIVTVHEISSHDGIDFIVMEYVVGKTLDRLIPHRGLPLKEVLSYAIQIADGLAAAHTAGIIHRDLKPGNVMVSDGGLVKVLDFGLAKLTTRAGSQGSDLPTMPASSSGPRTEAGTMLGTVSYMSPEQAEGKQLDARSDIFNFGLVLYEMITGCRAFAGESSLAILTAILKEEAKPVSQIVTGVPADLEKTINRCLRKEPERRWHTMLDVKVALLEVKEELDSAAHVTVPAPPRGRHWRLIWPALILALLVAGGTAVWWDRLTTKVVEAPLTIVPLTSYPGEERDPSFSPDGNQMAFSWNGEKQDNFDIYVKQISSGTQLRLTKAPEADSYPAWSPDGTSIAFLREGPVGKASVVLISPLGPPERKVAMISPTGRPTGLAWPPSGKWLVVTDRNSASEPWGLFLLSVDTGERRRLTLSPERGLMDRQPAFSPDGRTLAFVRDSKAGSSSSIYLLTLTEDLQLRGDPKRLTVEDSQFFNPVWTSTGQEIIFSSGNFLSPKALFRISASASGKTQQLAGVGESGEQLAISRNKERVAYTRELIDTNIWRLETPRPDGTISAPVKLISSTRTDWAAQFSPDGKKIVFNSDSTGSFEIWICDSDGSNAQPLTSMGTFCGSPSWSPDGERITFDSVVEGQWDVYIVSSSGGKPKRLTTHPANDSLARWTGDGKWIYFSSDRSGENQIWKMPAGGGESVQVTRKGGFEAFEAPDGRWLYYTKSDGVSSLWRMPRKGGEEAQVLESVNERAFAVAKEGIYFIPRPDSAGHYSIEFLNFATKRIRSILRIERPSMYLSVSPDGRWILYSQVDQVGSDLMLVENFR